MAEQAEVPDALRARMDAAVSPSADATAKARAAAERLHAVLDLIEQGRGIREAGSGLNAASSELLVADALLTDAAARASAGDTPVTLEDVVAALDLERLAARALALDGGAP